MRNTHKQTYVHSRKTPPPPQTKPVSPTPSKKPRDRVAPWCPRWLTRRQVGRSSAHVSMGRSIGKFMHARAVFPMHGSCSLSFRRLRPDRFHIYTKKSQSLGAVLRSFCYITCCRRSRNALAVCASMDDLSTSISKLMMICDACDFSNLSRFLSREACSYLNSKQVTMSRVLV